MNEDRASSASAHGTTLSGGNYGDYQMAGAIDNSGHVVGIVQAGGIVDLDSDTTATGSDNGGDTVQMEP